MAYSDDAYMYKLTFKDGSFITMLNSGANVDDLPGGEHTLILPNFYFGDIDGSEYEVTKYDNDGNKWVFTEDGVVINDTLDFRQEGSRMFLSYNPDTDKIQMNYQNPPPSDWPDFRESDRAVQGIAYNDDMSGTVFGSIGEAIYSGEIKYDRLSYGFYQITNVLPKSDNIPAYSINTFCASHSETMPYSQWASWGTGGTATTEKSIDIDSSINDFDPESIPDPYEPGGNSGTGGGTGDFDDSSDPIDIPSLPTLSATDTGFITLFNPSLTELRNLSDYLWSNLFDIASFKKLVADPMDLILGLSIVPVDVPAGSPKTIKIGGISTGISMTVASSQYVAVDCGTLNVNEYWGGYLDYDPYTEAAIYLPYIGTHPLKVDDIMGKSVQVVYHVDVLSGACTAYVKCGSSVLYQFIGQCSSSIPINANDWTSVVNGALNIATAIGSMVATKGASAPMALSQIASTAVNGMKPSVERSGSISGTGGLMAIQKPYIILTRPNQALPVNQNAYTGYPSFITENLGSLFGYTEIANINLQGVPGTDEELSEIVDLLKGGVIF